MTHIDGTSMSDLPIEIILFSSELHKDMSSLVGGKGPLTNLRLFPVNVIISVPRPSLKAGWIDVHLLCVRRLLNVY